jgi:hypothetical protein
MPEPWPPKPVFGWINYLAARTAVIPAALPSMWEWYEERSKKEIFILRAGPPDKANSEHAAAIRDMFYLIQWSEQATKSR